MTGRPKHLWSIYEKMVVRGKEFDDIHDLVGMRVIVESEKDCWAALGSIHAIWPPVQGRFKDYINSPEIQPVPVAPHDRHRSGREADRSPDPHPRDASPGRVRHRRSLGVQGASKDMAATTTAEMAWLQRIVDWQQETTDPSEFLETLKLDLEQDEVYVFTPKGKVIALPPVHTGRLRLRHPHRGRAPLHRCQGERPAGAARDQADSADTVEIITSKAPTAGPSRDWLRSWRLAAGPNKIRQWFSRERREDAIENGREELTKALRREGLPCRSWRSDDAFAELAVAMRYSDLAALHAAIGDERDVGPGGGATPAARAPGRRP